MATLKAAFQARTRAVAAAAFILIACPIWQGCIASRIMDSEDRKHYSEYLNETQRINLEREKAGLPASKPLTLDEWKGHK
jgi:hypothetical protein